MSGFKREGFQIDVARDGPQALAQFKKNSPDLVLLDVMLPGISGIDVCREIRSESAVPIIMVTAKSEEIDAVVGLEVGADDYVAKPYRLREIGCPNKGIVASFRDQRNLNHPWPRLQRTGIAGWRITPRQ